jgi:hypothetical protein
VNNKLVLAVIAAALIVGVAYVGTAQTTNLAGAKNTVYVENTSLPTAPAAGVTSVSITNVATTTMTAVTALANRERLIIKVNSADLTKAAFVNLGVAAATDAYGIRVDYNSPLEVELGAGVAVAFVSSGAAPLSIIQLAR